MDAVTADFCERVSTLWRCCDERPDDCRCSGALPSFEFAAMWNVPENIKVQLYLVDVEGTWKYGFTNPDFAEYFKEAAVALANHKPEFVGKPEEAMLTLGDLKTRSDLKRLTLDVDIKELLIFTSGLADQPGLHINGFEYLDNVPDGAILKKWLEERRFHSIDIYEFGEVDKARMDRDIVGRKPTRFRVGSVKNDELRHILTDYLKLGKLRQFFTVDLIFPFEVFEAIIANFRRDPKDYTGNNIEITADFEDDAQEKLEAMRKNGLCHIEDNCCVFEDGKRRIYVDYESIFRAFTITDRAEDKPATSGFRDSSSLDIVDKVFMVLLTFRLFVFIYQILDFTGPGKRFLCFLKEASD